MRNWRRSGWCSAVLVIGTLVVLAGCATRPEIGMGQAGALGPATPTPSGGGTTATATPPPSLGGGTATVEPVSPPTAVTETPVQAGPVQPGTPAPPTAKPAESPLKDVFFDFNRSVVRDDQQAALSADVAWLKTNLAARVTIEGHTDERGTAEYNLALGERRAKAVRDYLVAAGIDAGRLSTISYGKERPFVLGHDESAWRWNRRAHFVLK